MQKRSILTVAIAGAAFSLTISAATTRNVSNVTELTNAIAKASSGDVIVLAVGRYDLSTLTSCVNGTAWGTMSSPDTSAGTSCIWFNRTLTFKGADSTSWREKTAGQETILDGGGIATIIYPYTGSGRSSSYYNITFTNGVAVSGKNGGGIYAMGPTTGFVTNCVFRNCRAASGGGVYCLPAYDSLFENCSASNKGGGAYANGHNSYGSATNRYDGCVFVNCSANQGGGVYHFESRDMEGSRAGYIANCVFSNCTATVGGALYACNAGMVRGCRFVGNSSEAGAVYAESIQSSVITNCVFENNLSGASGGAVSQWNKVVACAFTGNVATNTGGAAIRCTSVESCGFTNNVALCVGPNSFGGGALSNVTAYSCTFVGNVSSNYGGAIARGIASNCVFESNSSKVQGGACAWSIVTDCAFTGNRAIGHRAGALYYSSATRCAFTNNYCAQSARGGACAYGDATECLFSGVGDVSCGSYDRCTFDGVVSATSPNQQKWVFDSLYHVGGSIYVTNCLVINCSVKYILNSDGRIGEFVNCTFANNTIADDGFIVCCNRGTDYNSHYFPSTNILVNCLFSGNRHASGNDADLALWKYPEATSAGYCSLQLYNCLYTAGLENADQVDAFENVVQGRANFVAGFPKFPDAPYYSLRYGSAARNRGVNAGWMASATDMAGNARINDGTVDIGCYECYLPSEGTVFFFR